MAVSGFVVVSSTDTAGVCGPLEPGGGAAATAGGLHRGTAELRGGLAVPDATVRERPAGGGEAFAVSSFAVLRL